MNSIVIFDIKIAADNLNLRLLEELKKRGNKAVRYSEILEYNNQFAIIVMKEDLHILTEEEEVRTSILDSTNNFLKTIAEEN